ncbi:AAC(3) family N-acetyltransferase [Streptomyces sp. H10-C2]|nr:MULTISPECIES: AAC(3) family N-acetyltransferase [unclassified Streptomyces]MDJ0343134.1 AAC(3) family N-acetyltransferase [Streptomyces sp. PH10-H1]MDJ0371076.1 AAC(3) family N-acetyltransferase [Streptomyces sp. H10-C2]
MTLLVHASLRSMRTVPGAAEAVLTALRAVLGPGGTVVVPSFTAENSDTSPHYRERTRGMSAGQLARYRDAMPPFDPAHTPAPAMGALAEAVRRAPGAVRSTHPQTSFAAVGARAAELLADHDGTCHLGERSPLARLYDAGASVLMIGVGYDVCSSFHLSEYRIPDPPRRMYRCVVLRDGERRWTSYEDVDLDDRDFEELGMAFEKSGLTRPPYPEAVLHGKVGGAASVLLRIKEAVDFGSVWLTENRRCGGARP